jgi:penicillin-binding protein 1A
MADHQPRRARRQASERQAEPRRRKAKGPKRRSFLWRWRRGLFLLGLLFVAAISGTGFVLAQIDLPPPHFQAQTTFICTAEVTDGCNQDNATARLFGGEDRVDVTLDQVPQVLVDAVLAAEDRDYFAHGGVDPVGIARAAWADIRGEGVQQGGSTITQQYVKTVYLTNERTIVRKIKEAVLAIKLEQELTKEQILERYLNAIYFGRGSCGVGTAARAYFDVDVGQLSLPQAAYLAGLIRAPEAADALRNPEEATRRRHTVLVAMLDEGMIDQAQFDAADAEPWVEGQTIQPRPDREGLGEVRGGGPTGYGVEYFIETVRQELQDLGFDDQEIYGGGLRVYTTLDHAAQQAAYEAVHEVLDRPEDPEAALVAIDATGAVRAMYGGDSFATNEFNYATASGGIGRQPGSSMKPFVLATAINNGISLDSKFEAPGRIELAIPGPDWRVSNYGGTEQGILTLVDATRVSSNTAYAQLMLEVGPDAVVQLAQRMGISRPLDPFPALVLGTEEVSPLDMATAYSTFANDGRHRTAHVIDRVVRPDGSEVRPRFDDEVVLPPEVNRQVVFALRQVVEAGTATSARLPNAPAAGKTGTTQNNVDAWFIGFTPNGLTASVWMGYEPTDTNGDGIGDQSREMSDVHGRAVTGGSFPATIWRTFMTRWVEIVGGDPGRFPSVGAFTGRVLNSDLSTTTSSIPPCGEGQEPTDDAPCETTTTLPPCVDDGASTSTPCEPTTTSSTATSETTTTLVPESTTAPPTTPTTAPPTTPATEPSTTAVTIINEDGASP